MSNISVTEELVALPLADLVERLGLAVAKANKALMGPEGTPVSGIVYSIDEAEVDLKVALSVQRESSGSISAGGGIAAFAFNASYASTYGFKEEGSSRIKLHLRASPRNTATDNG